MNRTEFLKLLNEDLESEYRSIVQYIQHVSSIKGAQYQNIIDEMRTHLNQELDHALILAQQIDFLGGTPSTNVADFPTIDDADKALKQDLSLERRQLERYRERVDQANDLGLPDIAEALAPLLRETQNHVQDLRAAINA